MRQYVPGGEIVQYSWKTLIFLHHSGDGVLLDTSYSPKHYRYLQATYISEILDIFVPKLCYRLDYKR